MVNIIQHRTGRSGELAAPRSQGDVSRSDFSRPAFSRPDFSRSDAEFARARRHSRLVRLLKIGLPVAAGLIVAAALAVTWLARSLPASLSVGSTSIEDGRVVMHDPRMSGVDGNNRPYTMVARRATQSLKGGGIDLEGIRASFTVDEATTADLSAAKGRFDPQASLLRLFDDITVDTSDGVTIRMAAADVSLSDGRLVGAGPVHVTAPNQTLESGTLTVQDGGKNISFGNRVKLTLLPSSGAGTGRRVTTGDQGP